MTLPIDLTLTAFLKTVFLRLKASSAFKVLNAVQLHEQRSGI